jgi:hypothetical protein
MTIEAHFKLNAQEEFWSLLSKIYSLMLIFQNRLSKAVWNKPIKFYKYFTNFYIAYLCMCLCVCVVYKTTTVWSQTLVLPQILWAALFTFVYSKNVKILSSSKKSENI